MGISFRTSLSYWISFSLPPLSPPPPPPISLSLSPEWLPPLVGLQSAWVSSVGSSCHDPVSHSPRPPSWTLPHSLSRQDCGHQSLLTSPLGWSQNLPKTAESNGLLPGWCTSQVDQKAMVWHSGEKQPDSRIRKQQSNTWIMNILTIVRMKQFYVNGRRCQHKIFK